MIEREDSAKLGFLVSDRWRQYKSAIFDRSYATCEYCLINKMDTAHHRINERIGYAYDQPHYWDLMAVCYQCHDHIHGKGENDEFYPGGPGDLGDNGFSRNKDTPGHWKTFIIDAVSWKAILPEIGPVCYDLTKQPKGNYRTFRKYHDSGNTFKNDRIILYVENQEAHEEFSWDEIKNKLELPEINKIHWNFIMNAPKMRTNKCRACGETINSIKNKMCTQCIGIICDCGCCPCSDPEWSPSKI